MTPQQFYEQTAGKYLDVDGNGQWCWDLMARFCQLVNVPLYPTIYCAKTGYVRDIWNLRHESGILNYFDEVPVGEFTNGTWVIWDDDYYMTPQSHVGMYLNGRCYNQTHNMPPYLLNLDFSKAKGGFMWKGWKNMDEFHYGLNYRNYEDADLVIYKGYDGYGLYILSAGEGKLKDIRDYDDPGLTIVSAVNAGYFEMNPNAPLPVGTHYGVEQSFDGVDLAPKQDGLLVFYETLNNGVNWCKSSQYWYSKPEVKFGITPYSVLVANGKQVNAHSTSYGNKDGLKNTQTMIAKVNDHWFFIVCRNQVYPETMLRYALYIGAEWAVLMDSGGSSQMMAWAGNEYRAEVYTGRHLPNVAVIAKEKPAGSIPLEPENPVGDNNSGKEEEPMPVDKEPVNEQNGIPKEKLTGLFGMTNDVYDALKIFALVILPAIITCLGTILEVMEVPDRGKIIAVLTAIATMLGTILGVSSKVYASKKAGGDDES